MPVIIRKTALSFRVQLTKDGHLRDNSRIDILPFAEQFIEYKFAKPIRRWIPGDKYRYYSTKRREIYFSHGFVDDFKQYVERFGDFVIEEEMVSLPGLKVKIDLKPTIKDRDLRQTLAIKWLTDFNGPLRGIALQTGGGKTYCIVKALSIIGERSLIRIDGLLDQWRDAIFQYTNLKPKDVYIMQGFHSVGKLVKKIDKGLKPKIILCSVGTIRGYSQDNENYGLFPDFDELITRLKVGVVVIDEAHSNFLSNLVVDLRGNAPITIPATATFDKNSEVGKYVFDKHYPPKIRFGLDMFKKYVKIVNVEYVSGQNDIPKFAYTGSEGYSHVMYENWLVRRAQNKLKWIVKSKYLQLFREHYINTRAFHPILNKFTKCLILCSTKDMCKYIKDTIDIEFKYLNSPLKTELFVEGSERSVLDSADVILSTPESAGTGTDIPLLQTMICTVNTRSKVYLKQFVGRLREPPENFFFQTTYVNVYNASVPKHIEYQDTCQGVFRELAKDYSWHKM